MAITTLDGYIAAAKQKLHFVKTVARATLAAAWFSLFDLAGDPGAGVFAVGNTANGLVPTTSTVGMPTINAFGGGAGYLSIVDYGNIVAARMMIYDRLFHAGAYAFTAGTTALSAQPSYSGRVPNGTDFTNTEIWIEVTTAFLTGTAWQVQITYTNGAGTAGRTSVIIPAQVAANLILGRMIQIPLQAGDVGVQKIESVIVTNGGTAMTAGNFNVLVIRPLWMGRVAIANDGQVHGIDKTGMPVVFATSALQVAVCADAVSSGTPELLIEIVNG